MCVFIKYKWHEACNLVSTESNSPMVIEYNPFGDASARACMCVCRCVFAFHFVHRAVFIFKWGKLSVRNINNYDCFIPLTINRERSFCVVIIAIAVVIVIIITSTATPQIFSLSHRFRSHIHNLFTDKCANRNACRWSKIITPHGKLVYLSCLKIWHD